VRLRSEGWGCRWQLIDPENLDPSSGLGLVIVGAFLLAPDSYTFNIGETVAVAVKSAIPMSAKPIMATTTLSWRPRLLNMVLEWRRAALLPEPSSCHRVRHDTPVVIVTKPISDGSGVIR
jgi:hypothetical protein